MDDYAQQLEIAAYTLSKALPEAALRMDMPEPGIEPAIVSEDTDPGRCSVAQRISGLAR